MNSSSADKFLIDEFLRTNAGLVRLLRALDKASPKGLHTRAVCEQVFDSRSYGLVILKRAASLGLIKRYDPVPPKRKGGWMIVNHITPKGRSLLTKLQKQNK
jgi:hypothetical protein